MIRASKWASGRRGPIVNRPTAMCELTGKVVSTWTEEWRYDCELRAILAMSKSDRDAYFHGAKDDSGRRGVVAIRGVTAAERILADVRRLEENRAVKKAS